MDEGYFQELWHLTNGHTTEEVALPPRSNPDCPRSRAPPAPLPATVIAIFFPDELALTGSRKEEEGYALGHVGEVNATVIHPGE